MIEIKIQKVKAQNNKKKTLKRCQPKKKLDGSYGKLECIIPSNILLPQIWGSFIKNDIITQDSVNASVWHISDKRNDTFT